MDEELRAGFIEWQKIVDRVNWTKLIQILKESCIERLNKKLSVKLILDKEESPSVNTGREFRQDSVCQRFYSIYTANTLLRKLLNGLEDSKEEDK
jgi:hypothetical protein